MSVYHIFFVCSSVSGYLGGFYVLTVVNNFTVSTGVHVSFSIVVFSGYMASSGVVGSYGSFIPSFLRNLHNVS